jgi:hypothetical protein
MPFFHRFVSLLLLSSFLLQFSLPALASEKNESEAPKEVSCPQNLEVNLQERSEIGMFHAKLSSLLRHYGKPSFESKLQSIVNEHWPKPKGIEISPTYWERTLSLVDMARVRHFISLTLKQNDYQGIEDEDYYWFERHMKHIMLTGSTANDLRHNFEKHTANLIKKISKSKATKEYSKEEWEVVKAEAIARVSEMFTFLSRWRVINGKIIDEKGAAAAQTIAILAIGAVGAGVLVSTMVISGPMVAGAGAYAGTFSANPVVSGLLVKVAETAAGSLLGVVGAPAAMMVQDSYFTLSEASKQSKNNQSTYTCELVKRVNIWKSQATGDYFQAAVSGGALGFAGGALTMTRAGAQMVLYATGFGVGVAQLFATGKMGIKTVEALAHYKMAEEALAAGNRELAVQLLHKARDLSQAAGEKALESIIIGVLSYYLVNNFLPAMKSGAGSIRVLYANSADTIPMAEKEVEDAIRGK